MITFGSCCSGIEAASMAWKPLGWQAVWLAEIEPFPCSVLAHHYPNVPNLGDMTTIASKIKKGLIDAPDILVGGTPCQSFSIAGMRAGLADPRGQLTYSYVEIADAIDAARVVRGEQSCITLWENVPGVLSDKSNAFGCFLAALVGEDVELQPSGGKWTDAGCVYGPKRAAAWRILDAQYFGLAQRRRRVFVIASAREGFNPFEILFESEGVRRDIAPSREQREEATTHVRRCLASGNPAIGMLTASQGDKLWLGNQEAFTGDYHILEQKWWSGSEISETITATSDDQRMPDKNRFQCVITLASKQQSLNTDENLALTICATDYKEPQVVCVHGTQDPDINYNFAHTLGCNDGQENVICCMGGKHPNAAICNDGTSPTLTSAMGEEGGHIPAVVYPLNSMTMLGRPCDEDSHKRVGLGVGDDGDPCPTLTKAHSHAVAYAFDSLSSNSMKSSNPHSGCRQTEIAKTLDTTVPCPSKNQGGIGVLQNNLEIAYGIPGNWIGRKPENGGNATEPHFERSPCLTATDKHGVAFGFRASGQDGFTPDVIAPPVCATDGGGCGVPSVFTPLNLAVRRLTPRECERLQGFPDDWTLVPHKGKIGADSPRYKALGNSMAVNVMVWLGHRLDGFIKS